MSCFAFCVKNSSPKEQQLLSDHTSANPPHILHQRVFIPAEHRHSTCFLPETSRNSHRSNKHARTLQKLKSFKDRPSGRALTGRHSTSVTSPSFSKKLARRLMTSNTCARRDGYEWPDERFCCSLFWTQSFRYMSESILEGLKILSLHWHSGDGILKKSLYPPLGFTEADSRPLEVYSRVPIGFLSVRRWN